MSTAETDPGYHERRERWTPNRLIGLFQGQFSDAIAKEESEAARASSFVNGTYIHFESLNAAKRLAQNAYKIVMKAPHPHDRPESFGEIFAARPNGFMPTDLDRRQAAHAVNFFIHDVEGEVEKWYVLDANGAYEIPTEDQITDSEIDEFFLDAPANKPLDDTESLGQKYSGRNLVAIAPPHAA